MCKVDLEQLGLAYYQGRGSEKHKVADILLADILIALTNLMVLTDFLLFTVKHMT